MECSILAVFNSTSLEQDLATAFRFWEERRRALGDGQVSVWGSSCSVS